VCQLCITLDSVRPVTGFSLFDNFSPAQLVRPRHHSPRRLRPGYQRRPTCYHRRRPCYQRQLENPGHPMEIATQWFYLSADGWSYQPVRPWSFRLERKFIRGPECGWNETCPIELLPGKSSVNHRTNWSAYGSVAFPRNSFTFLCSPENTQSTLNEFFTRCRRVQNVIMIF
jgi:hypothetical protein